VKVEDDGQKKEPIGEALQNIEPIEVSIIIIAIVHIG
jgi:hypothetical protein